jgi:hypothetical protein
LEEQVTWEREIPSESKKGFRTRNLMSLVFVTRRRVTRHTNVDIHYLVTFVDSTTIMWLSVGGSSQKPKTDFIV